MPLAVAQHEREGRRTIAVVGELDIGSAPRLEAAVEEWAERGMELVIDLAELTFIDSSGIRCVLAAMDACANALHAVAHSLTPRLAGRDVPRTRARAHAAVAGRTDARARPIAMNAVATANATRGAETLRGRGAGERTASVGR